MATHTLGADVKPGRRPNFDLCFQLFGSDIRSLGVAFPHESKDMKYEFYISWSEVKGDPERLKETCWLEERGFHPWNDVAWPIGRKTVRYVLR